MSMKMNQNQLLRLSKFLSLILRHKPELVGVELDEAGWAEVDQLIEPANRAGVPLTQRSLQEVVARNNKKRFSLSEDGNRIRANQGHSIPVDLGLEPVRPPEKLFHGTAVRFLGSIRQGGLVAKGRNHVHLSPDPETALGVGQRHGRAVVLIIHAGRMFKQGHRFYRPANDVWLTEAVSAEFIQFPDDG
jgi:putative RNA 2'-phosphotransferase